MREAEREQNLGAGLMRVSQAAEWLGISRAGVYRLLNEGEIRSIRVGAARLIPRYAVHDFALKRIQEAQADG